jgi:hypothetical protein
MSSGPGNFFANIGGRVSNTVNSNGVSKWIYAVIAIIIIIIILMLMGVRFNIIPDLRATGKIVESQSELFWKPEETGYALVVSEKQSPKDFRDDSYTIIVDMLWSNTRTWSSRTIYRHILHKGSDELSPADKKSPMEMFGIQNAVSRCKNNQGTNLPPSGLPKRLNPGIFADPVKNDILIFVDTQKDGRRLRESLRVVDIPMDIPFRLGLILHKTFIEVYINCRLDATLVLRGEPIKVDPEWYGLSGPYSLAAQIQNLRIWKEPLVADFIKTQCSAKFSSFKPRAASCPDVMNEEKVVKKETTSNSKIGYGNSLTKC